LWVGTITDDVKQPFQKWLRKRNLVAGTIENIWHCLRSIHRDSGGKVSLRTIEQIAVAGTLEFEYVNSIRPLWNDVLLQRSMSEIDHAVCYFVQWRGGPTEIAELSDEMVEQLMHWFENEQGFSKRTVIKYGRNLRRVVRAIDRSLCRARWEGRPGNWKPRSKNVETSAQPGTVRHFFETVYKVRKLLGKSPNTVRLYANTFRNFRHYLGREALLSDLNEEAIAGLVTWHLERGRTVETAVKDAGQLMAIARYAARKRAIEIEPELTLPVPPQRAPMAWMKDELAAIFSAVDELPGRIGQHQARDWWRALLLMLYYTAERVGALIALRWENVNLRQSSVLVPAELRKGRRADKHFPLPPVAIKALLKLKAEAGTEKVFEWPLCREMI
jgi:site-specific recombinase XerD